MRRTGAWIVLMVAATLAVSVEAQRRGGGGPAPALTPLPPADARTTKLKELVSAEIKSQPMFDLGQQMNDMVFSFGELGFQEFETQRYLGKVLRDNGFTVEDGVAGIPTAWVARWGSGHPILAFGSDVDCIPQASQNPGGAHTG